MYQVIVPLMNHSVTPKTRDSYLMQFKNAKIDKILLCTFGYGPDPDQDVITASHLRENIEFFRKKGIDAGVWIGCTIGHGVALSFGTDNNSNLLQYTKMVNLAGQEREYTCCPLDETFRKRIANYVSTLATCGTNLILLDDDFRMSMHGPEFCCACDLHMARIRELCGENISREELKTLAFSQKANKYRNAWMAAQKESLELLATDIRESVNKVAPHVRVGNCACAAIFGVDGTDPVQLSNILAGKNTAPFMRLHGAPYHATHLMPHVIETARLFAYFCQNCGVELYAEGDTYPRPRYNTPSSTLEMFDAALRIDGQHDGILKYMVDYNSSAEFETYYMRRHTRNLPLMEQISEMFAGKQMLGVNVSSHRDLFSDADLEMGVSGYYPDSLAGTMLALNGISTVYGDGGICHAVLGEEARHIDLAQIKKGAILDGIAAQILTDRGMDVGLKDKVTFIETSTSYLSDPEGKEKAFITPPYVRYADMKLSVKAKPVCKAHFEQEQKTFAYSYENPDGARFLVYCFDAKALSKDTGMYRGYMQQKILKEGIAWISGKKLPAFMEKCPNLYVMCKGGDGKMAVALFNFYIDSVDEPMIQLDREYSTIRFLNCKGRLEGDTVILDDSIYAYTFVAFEVS